MPSDEDQLSPHLGNHIFWMAPEHSTAFHKRFHILAIRSKQKDEVVGQFTISRMARNQPSELCLLLGNPGCISRGQVGNAVVP